MSDVRVARAAAAHRGLTYTRRRSLAPVEWSARMAYAVGVIATDGCLVKDGRHAAFVTKDEDLMRAWLTCIGHEQLRYSRPISRAGTTIYRIQVSDVGLYRFLMSIGLTARKSLTFGRFDVPDRLFDDTSFAVCWMAMARSICAAIAPRGARTLTTGTRGCGPI